MSKGFLGVIAVVVLVFIGIFAFSGHKNNNSSSGSSAKATNHIEGNTKSDVALVEYGDYECPYCGQYYPVVKQVVADFGDQISFQFRNFPLTSIHPNAFAAARAAEAAGMQGKYWQMHDLLYQNQNQWASSSSPSPYFNQYAKQIGLNISQFQKDYVSSKVNDAINADMAAGTKLKIQGTPTFYINGKEIQVSADVNSFETQIKNALSQKSGGSASSNTPNTGTTSQTPDTTPKSGN